MAISQFTRLSANANADVGTNGTWTGTEQYAAGSPNNAWNFNGSSQVGLGNAAWLNFGTSSFSMGFSFNHTSTNTFMSGMTTRQSAGQNNFVLIYPWWSSGGQIAMQMGDGSNFDTTTATWVNDGKWHRVIGVRDTSGVKAYLYIDWYLGNATQTVSLTTTWSTSNSDNKYYGAQNGANFYTGKMCELFADSTTAWSPAMVKNDWARLKGFF